MPRTNMEPKSILVILNPRRESLMGRLLDLRWVKRALILFFLSMMVVSATEIVVGSAGYAGRYVLAFLAAVGGTVAASIAVALNSPITDAEKPPTSPTKTEHEPSE